MTMSLPDFDDFGDLPPGVHSATIEEVQSRFAIQTERRILLGERLCHIRNVARRTGKLIRFVVFGSFVTTKPDPNDVDVAMVMDDAFRYADVDDAAAAVFDHRRAQDELNASVFWIRPSHLFRGTIDDFLSDWQVTRVKTRRGIVEIQNDSE
jgi:hypothetical protein